MTWSYAITFYDCHSGKIYSLSAFCMDAYPFISSFVDVIVSGWLSPLFVVAFAIVLTAHVCVRTVCFPSIFTLKTTRRHTIHVHSFFLYFLRVKGSRTARKYGKIHRKINSWHVIIRAMVFVAFAFCFCALVIFLFCFSFSFFKAFLLFAMSADILALRCVQRVWNMYHECSFEFFLPKLTKIYYQLALVTCGFMEYLRRYFPNENRPTSKVDSSMPFFFLYYCSPCNSPSRQRDM